MRTSSTEQFNPVKLNANTFLTLSNIALSSAERLAALNLNVARTAVEESIAALGAKPMGRDSKEQQNRRAATPGAATKSAIEYLHHVQEIATETQSEVSKVMASYFNADREAMSKGLALFKNASQQMSRTMKSDGQAVDEALEANEEADDDIAETNVKAVHETSSKTAHAAPSHPKKAG